MIPVANAFIATTSIISWGKNKTFIGDDEKYAAQPGLFPRQPGTSIKFNFTGDKKQLINNVLYFLTCYLYTFQKFQQIRLLCIYQILLPLTMKHL